MDAATKAALCGCGREHQIFALEQRARAAEKFLAMSVEVQSRQRQDALTAQARAALAGDEEALAAFRAMLV